MKLVEFQVFNFRNIIDSGPVTVRNIAALVGQNECGKSNLLEALFRFNAFDGQGYDLARDWPIDRWGEQEPSAVVCKAIFDLDAAEIVDLTARCSRARGAPSEDAIEPTAEMSALLPIERVTVSKTYANTYTVQLDRDLSDLADMEAAKQLILAQMPKCVYVDDYIIFKGVVELDRYAPKIQRRHKLTQEEQTIQIMLDLAKLDVTDLHARGGTVEGRRMRGYDVKAASARLSKEFTPKWNLKQVDFDIRVDGNTLELLVKDFGLNAYVPLHQRSRGFQWFVSFIWRFTFASKGEYANCILLLDEPGIHLHHAAHLDLLAFLEELSAHNTLIYTTHLATMLDLGSPERIKIVEVHDHHGSVLNGMVSKQAHPMMVIEAALGLNGAMNGLLGSRQNLVVQGMDEMLILGKLSSVLQELKEKGLSERVHIVPAHGACRTPMYAGFMMGNKYDAAVLLDSNEKGEWARKKISEQPCATDSKFRVLMLKDVLRSTQNETAIEDLFPPEFYLKCVNEAYRVNIEAKDLPTDGSDSLPKRVERVLVARGQADALDKERVMMVMQRRFDRITKKQDLPPGTYEKARRLIDRINEALG